MLAKTQQYLYPTAGATLKIGKICCILLVLQGMGQAEGELICSASASGADVTNYSGGAIPRGETKPSAEMVIWLEVSKRS